MDQSVVRAHTEQDPSEFEVGSLETLTSGRTSHRIRIRALVSAIGQDLHEREDIIALALLGALCGQNVFLFGPPGTAKSLISRRVACAFETECYFEYLMHRFSTPEEVFGPISIRDLKEDRYIRKTEHHLPKADFAFLDEIWKSSPAILNTLLTLINERIFRNGTEIQPAPLKALIAASNEIPAAHQGLEALYDRFLLRLLVGPIAEPAHFEALLCQPPASADAALPNGLAVTQDEWAAWRKGLAAVELSAETLLIFRLLRERLARQPDDLGLYVSDRRWQRAALLMKAAAFFNDRRATNHSDAALLQHCLWSTPENREQLRQLVEEAIEAAGFDPGCNLADLDRQRDDLDHEIRRELFFTDDVHETIRVGEQEFYALVIQHDNGGFHAQGRRQPIRLLIPKDKARTNNTFHPQDEHLNEVKGISCTFAGQAVCKLAPPNVQGPAIAAFRARIAGHEWVVPATFTPRILFHRGDRKADVNLRLRAELRRSAGTLQNAYREALRTVIDRLSEYERQLSSPFATPAEQRLALNGIERQIQDLNLRIADCARLEALCE